MQSPFHYSSYASSPGEMDFYYGPTQPIYDQPFGDLDTTTSFAIPEFMNGTPNSFTSAPYTFSSGFEIAPGYETPMATSGPGSDSSACGSVYGGSNWNPTAEELLPMPSYPLLSDDSGPDSPPSQNKPTKPFGCDHCGKSFTRFADLKRHSTSVHYPVFRDCPVEHCSRKGSNGFPRQDHLKEHLRSYHHLDVPKRRAVKRSAKTAEL
ncbi:hypothetical protein N7539_009261 [Penicillium diatomitis]|uniref:C2H2-type domain-containing protein n=1 Tax=Penicillium diatomitis TaxID=2819901 RepID=A0A9X0BJS6_9EURO|nr:uncharacterized protein N7539_009261 [Penicillium diatomitis]KAJ5469643.1 hypothetical protein N7539_009261 [Penicillium diatomitis]